MRHFAVELEELNQALLEMGALVESSIHCSVQALVDRDERMARRVIDDEKRINQMELDIDSRVTRLLALNQPVAGDLRLLIIALKINTDLERMGDLAVNIAERAISLSKVAAGQASDRHAPHGVLSRGHAPPEPGCVRQARRRARRQGASRRR